MRLLLDTNVVVALIRLKPEVVEALSNYGPVDVAISSLSTFELIYGAHKSQRVAANLQVVADLGLSVLPFEARDAGVAGEVRARLEGRGAPIGPYDTLIAGQALARDLTLITRNIREFSRVDGLRVENWET